jgi:hypothetical protein
MALPVWLIPLLLTAGSAGANYQAQRKTDKARAGVIQQERMRREAMERKSTASAQSTADLLLAAKGKEQARAAEVEAAMAAAPPSPTPTAPLTSPVTSTGAKVQTVPSAHEARAREYVGRFGKNQAALRSFGDVMGMSQLEAGRNEQDINQANIAMRNWAQNVMPAQFAKANLAGRDWATTADILQAAAALYSGYALTAPAGAGGAGAAGGSATVPSSTVVTPSATGTSTYFGGGSPWVGGEVPLAGELGTTTNFMQPSAQELAWYKYLGGGRTPPVSF